MKEASFFSCFFSNRLFQKNTRTKYEVCMCHDLHDFYQSRYIRAIKFCFCHTFVWMFSSSTALSLLPMLPKYYNQGHFVRLTYWVALNEWSFEDKVYLMNSYEILWINLLHVHTLTRQVMIIVCIRGGQTKAPWAHAAHRLLWWGPPRTLHKILHNTAFLPSFSNVSITMTVKEQRRGAGWSHTNSWHRSLS